MCAMVSPNAVALAEAAGEGTQITLPLGGVLETKFCRAPFVVDMVVEKIFDAKIEIQRGHGVPFSDRILHSRMLLDPTHVRFKRICV